MLQSIAKLVKVLNSETNPSQISLALSFSLIAGLTPLYSLHNLLVLLVVLLFRVNLSAFFLGWVSFSGISYILNPLFHKIGFAVLTASSLKGMWTLLYNSPLRGLENLNNTVVMGSLLTSMILFLPLHFLVKQMVIRYREHMLAWVNKTRFMQVFTAGKFYRIYQSITS